MVSLHYQKGGMRLTTNTRSVVDDRKLGSAETLFGHKRDTCLIHESDSRVLMSGTPVTRT